MLKGYKIKKTSREVVEPEEVLLDAHLYQADADDFLAGEKIEKPVAPKATVIFLSLMGVVLLVLLGRISYLQFWRGEKYRTLAQNTQIFEVPLLAPRGLIYDANKNVLAQNRATYDLLINPTMFASSALEQEENLEKLQKIIGELPPEKIQELAATQEKETVILKANIGHNEMLELKGRINEFPGLFIEESTLRFYPLGEAAANLLGYLGSIAREEKKSYQGYFLSEKVGRDGLESQYESWLRGQPGQKRYFMDSRLNQSGMVFEEKGSEGDSLLLNLDAALQEKLFSALEKKYLALKKSQGDVGGAAAVILDPRNGGVKALVSLPSFDNNKIVQGLNQQEFSDIFENESRPLLNRTIAGQYPSGSTIKPVMAAAGLQEKIVTPQTKIDDMGGVLRLGGYSFGDWAVHGVVNLYSAIAESCNVYFYILGGGYQNREGLGIERMVNYFRKFGFGEKTGIDLPGEKTGFVPTPEWKEENKNEVWYIGDTYHVAIGQGDFLTTPLQLAQAISVIANGGTLFRPQVVDKIIDSQENVINDISPEVVSENFIEANYLGEIKKAMRQAVTEGSSVQLASLPVAVAGKTGTAQTGKGNQTHAWFVGFAPYENPEIAIVILVENGGEGHAAAVPVAKEVLTWYFSER